MLKKLRNVSFLLGLFVANVAFAQLPNGSIAPNFTYTDINGVSQNLYTYLNAGKTVYIDVSAAWCGPCWNFHSGATAGGDNILKFINVSSSTSAGVSSYTSAPTITINGGNGTGAVAQAVLTNGVVTKIKITDHGTGYTALPTITIGTSWTATTTVNVGDQVFAGNNLYTVSTAGTTSNVAPTHTASYSGTLWTASTAVTTGTQIYYGNNLYVVTADGVTGTDPLTHTSGSVTDGTATIDFVGQTGPEQNNGSAVLKYAGIAAKGVCPAGAVGKEAALHELWRKHGPTGEDGVEASTTNDIVVLFVEAQLTNTSAQLNGVDAGNTYATDTKGNWVQGVTYPIIDLPNNASGQAFNTNYNIAYFPTLYMICPNRAITEVGQAEYADLYDQKSNCPAPASAPLDAALLGLNSNVTETCNSVPLKVTLQNNGTSALTSCAIEVKVAGSQIATYSWSGNLATYATQVLTVTNVNPAANTVYDINVITSDADANNNTQSFSINKAPLANKKNIKIEVATDKWGNETSWKLYNSSNTVVTSGGPYTTYTSNGPHLQTVYEADLVDDCYRFEILDSYGDGIFGAGGGDGYYKIYSNNVLVYQQLAFSGESDTKKFELIHEEDVTGIKELEINNGMLIFPNPSNSATNISFELKKSLNVTVNVANTLGQTVYNADLGVLEKGVNAHEFDASNLNNGLYFVTVNMGETKVTQKLTINK